MARRKDAISGGKLLPPSEEVVGIRRFGPADIRMDQSTPVGFSGSGLVRGSAGGLLEGGVHPPPFYGGRHYK